MRDAHHQRWVMLVGASQPHTIVRKSIAKQARMPLRGGGGDGNGRLTLDARITACPGSAVF
jgi:hypothetical protein